MGLMALRWVMQRWCCACGDAVYVIGVLLGIMNCAEAEGSQVLPSMAGSHNL
jgi:hypothetical protein